MISHSVQEDGKAQPAQRRQWIETERDLPVLAPHFATYAWLDTAACVFLVILALPIIVALLVLTKITSRGAGIYRQTRVGLGGDVFVLYKIRTMSHNAEADTGPVWTSGVADPRVTALGRFMRSSHLDELPQLFNVLKGDMSLIGPRPERPEFTHFLAQEIPGYAGRLSIKPGITGLEQINLPPDTDLDSVRKKLELDLEYITRSTFVLDIKIMLCTALKMVGLRGYTVANWLGLVSWPKGLSGLGDTWSWRRRRASGEGSEKNDSDSDQSSDSVALSELVGSSVAGYVQPESEVSEAANRIGFVESSTNGSDTVGAVRESGGEQRG